MPNDHPLQELVAVLRQTEVHLSRLADHFDPPPPDIVGTPYVADKLGCTTDWIAMLVRDGEIPVSCLVPGTGNGKPWKFYRARIDEWIERR
jgi:predicted DNA-binding transcriptional regulator AlpA